MYQLSIKFKKNIFATIVIATSPWIFILSKEYNPVTYLVLMSYAILIKEKVSKMLVYFSYLVFFFLISLILKNSNSNYFVEKILILKNQFNFSSLFFQMENISFYFHVPKVGYFLIPTLIIFLLGLSKLKKIKRLFLLLLFAFIFYFYYPTNHFIFAGLGFIIFFQLIILYGYEQMNNRLINIIFILLILINFSFFLESYFRHYQIKYGAERKYAELKLIHYIQKSKFSKIYFLKNGDIQKWFKIYSYHYIMPKSEFDLDEKKLNRVKNECFNKETLCVIDQDLLKSIALKEDDSRLTFIRNSDGLKVYYLL